MCQLDLVKETKTVSAVGCLESCPVLRCRQTCWELWSLARSMLSTGLGRAVGADELDKLLERILVMVVADGGVGEVRAGLLDDGGRREMKSGG